MLGMQGPQNPGPVPHGIPPWLQPSIQEAGCEAGGRIVGHMQDASLGLQIMAAPRAGGSHPGAMDFWAFNPLMNEWENLHTVFSGDILTALAKRYYGAGTIENARRIRNVPQNRAIVGDAMDMAIPGDVLLIPGLPQPASAPAPGVIGTPGVQGSAAPTADLLPGEPPPWWPPGLAWPPTDTPPNLTQTAPPGGTTTIPTVISASPPEPTAPPPAPGFPLSLPPGFEFPSTLPGIPGFQGTNGQIIPASAPAGAPAAGAGEEKKTEGLSTGAKVAIGVGAVAVVGTAIYFIARKPRRRGRR